MNKIVGVLELASKYRYGLTSRGAPMYLFRPYDEAFPEYIVGSTERDISRNQIAIVDVPSESKEPKDPEEQQQKTRGSLVRLIGPVGDFAAEREALLQHYCPHKTTVTEEVVDVSDDPIRKHLCAETGWTTFHIDPPGCRDIDDAVAYHPDTKTWAITIADAAAAVPLDSFAGCAAKQIGSTFYDLDGRVVRAMLPAIISENTASLLPGQPRRGVTLFLEADGTESFALTWITVDYSFTYESFVASHIAFDLRISRDPHSWIEELMIRYNRAVAATLKAAGVGLLRVQPPSTVASVITASLDPELRFLMNEAASYEAVSEKQQVHATLGLYCHASSPLRRYADLTNQRILKTIITKKPHLSVADDRLAAYLNDRTQAGRRWTRDLTFLTYVTPGRIHTIDVVWLPLEDKVQVWVPAWRRIIRLRHSDDAIKPVGSRGRIRIFCDPTKRNWKQRILTAPFLV